MHLDCTLFIIAIKDEGAVSSMQVAKKMVAKQAGTARPIKDEGSRASIKYITDQDSEYK